MGVQTHELKTWGSYWDAVSSGEKVFEVRRDDRGFQKGDVLHLVRMRQNYDGKWVEDRDHNNGRRVLVRKISYVLTGGQLGIEPGYVVMGLKK